MITALQFADAFTDWQAVLSAHPLLRGLSSEALEALGADAVVQRVRRGQCIFEYGARPNGVFLVLEGRVSFQTVGVDGRQHIIELFGPGRMFGDVGLIWGATYGAEARTVEDTLLIKLSTEALMAELRRNPELGLRIITALSERVRNLCDRIGYYATSSAQARVAAYVLNLSDRSSMKTAPVKLPAQKQIVASLLNMTSEAFSRALRRLSEAGAISIHGRDIQLLDRVCLEGFLAEETAPERANPAQDSDT